MHLYSYNLSAIAKIPSSITSEIFPAGFSCGNKFNLSHSSSEFSGRNIVKIPEALKAGDLSSFISDLSHRVSIA